MSAIDAFALDTIASRGVPLRVERVESLVALEALRPDYERLSRAGGNTSPFALLDWHLAWCTHFLNLDSKVEDRLAIYLMRDGDVCVAILPFVSSRRRLGPLSLVTMDLLGSDPSTTESRTPLIEQGYERRAIEALRRSLARDASWDWISWCNVSGPVLQALTHPGSGAEPEAPGYVLDLKSTWEEFRRSLKRNIRESLRHCYNSLQRAGHGFSVDIAVEPADVQLGIERFLALHALRAAMPGTAPHHNHFATAISQSFLYDVCARLSAAGVVRVFQLRIDGEVVAVRIGFVVGEILNLYYSGFDPRWARYSVMTTTVAEAIKYAISQGLKSVNLSRGTDPSKIRWGPRTIEYGGVLERRERWRSRLLHALYREVRADHPWAVWASRRLSRFRRRWR